jgi:hypothetical protein
MNNDAADARKRVKRERVEFTKIDLSLAIFGSVDSDVTYMIALK